jgi:hypothetical protein
MNDQLSFDVTPHPALTGGKELTIAGEVRLKGGLPVNVDLNHGDELTITIADKHGQIIARHYTEVAAPPPFIPIEEKDLGLIGYVRRHTLTPTADALNGPE